MKAASIKTWALALVTCLILTWGIQGSRAQIDSSLVEASSPSLSMDGRILAYTSMQDGSSQVIVFDRSQGMKTQIIPTAPQNTGRAWSFQPAVSAGGRQVAFTSFSLEQGESTANIFLYDLNTKAVERISKAPDGAPADAWSEGPAISGDGRYVAYSSLASNLVPGLRDSNGQADVFLFDRQTRNTSLVSRTAQGTPDNGWSYLANISADGRFIAFISMAGDLLEGNPLEPGKPRLYLYDRASGLTIWIHSGSPAGDLEIARLLPQLSADGGQVLFAAWMKPSQGDPAAVAALFLYSSDTQGVRQLPDSQALSAQGLQFAVSPDGGQIFYMSSPDELRIYKTSTGAVSLYKTNLSGGLNASSKMTAAAGGQLAVTTVEASGANTLQFLEFGKNPPTGGVLAGWVVDPLGSPIAAATIQLGAYRSTTTDRAGRFRFDDLPPGTYHLTASKKGFAFQPGSILVRVGSDFGVQYGISFSASPDEILAAAREDLGMPYAMKRGCPSPFRECGGPYSGFYSGDCTDLILDAFRKGAEFNIQLALERDFHDHPDHYYRWRNARSSQDMWRFFVYTGQMLDPMQAYQPGDLVFFDWDNDGITDHVSLVSEVNSRNRPRKMYDATGKVNDNSSGLATETDWKYFHDSHVTGHARWRGITRLSNPEPELGPHLLIALDSRAVKLRVLNINGREVGAASVANPAAQDPSASNGVVVRLPADTIQESTATSGWFFIELSSQAGGAYQLGLQAIQNGIINQSTYIQNALPENGQVLIPLRWAARSNLLGYEVSNLPENLTSAASPPP